jgi:NAD(P)-dependent dehydrogenase (short-subunit alcohol dehydrogenase family)
MKEKFWKNKTIIITGASSGIGEAIFHKLETIAGRIYLLSRNPPPDFHNVDGRHIFQSVDLSDPMSVESVITAIRKSEALSDNSRGIDVLFNNAGITAHGRFDSTKMEVFRKTFETNFFGPIRLVQGLHDFLLMAKGTVVSTSTVSGLYGVPGRAAYSSSKSALHAAMESYRIEMLETGVRSIIVCPPYTKTKLRTSGLDAEGNILDEPQAGSKIKTPEEVAEAIIQATENPKSRLVTIDKSGFAMKVLRLFSPKTLEKIMFKKLYKDFH